MEIRDVIHGSIVIERSELPIVDSKYFQRLRQIKQLGFAEYSFPSATHNRYAHSLGAMETATQAFETIFGFQKHQESKKKKNSPHNWAEPCTQIASTHPNAYSRFRAVTRLAALLHDIGHGPLSHTTEFAMPPVNQLNVPGQPEEDRIATHEDYTLKIILDSGLTPLLNDAGKNQGFNAWHVAALIQPELSIKDEFFQETVDGEKLDFRPILQQVISSELDADRMDYLQRDSSFAGVSYGKFDFDWLIGNLTAHAKDGEVFLGIQHRALYPFEDFLISRYHMFLMVYFHYKSVVFDEMLGQYFASPDCSYTLPAQIEDYIKCTDAHLYAHLAQSENPWAKRISEKTAFRMLIETHSGIPATTTAAKAQAEMIEGVKQELSKKGIFYIESTSTGELSKYFRTESDPIFVRYDNYYNAPHFIQLNECTDLFKRYREKRSITRIYVSPEDHAQCRFDGRHAPLQMEQSLFTLTP